MDINRELRNVIDQILENIKDDLKARNGNLIKSNIDDLCLWLFKYRKETDTLKHWHIITPEKTARTRKFKKASDLLLRTEIKGGRGTIGFVLRSEKLEMVNNTFDDPRGTVSLEDTLLKNYSWLGIPIKDNGEVKLIISLYFQNFNAWKNLKEIEEAFKQINSLPDIKELIKELILLYELDKIKEQRDLITSEIRFEEKEEEDLYSSSLEKIQNFLYYFLPVSYLFILKNDDSRGYFIPSEKFLQLDFKNTNLRFAKEFQWCCSFKHRPKNCIINQILNENTNKNNPFYSELKINQYKCNKQNTNNICALNKHFFEILSPFTDLTHIIYKNNSAFSLRFSFLGNQKKVEQYTNQFMNDLKKFNFEYFIKYLSKYNECETEIKGANSRNIKKLFKKRKILVESAVMVFKFIAHYLYLPEEKLTLKYKIWNEKNKDKAVTEYLKLIEYAANISKKEIVKKREKFINSLKEMRNKYIKSMNENLAIVSFLKTKENDLLIEKIKGLKDKEVFENFKEPSNINVIFRALNSGDKDYANEILNTYRPLITGKNNYVPKGYNPLIFERNNGQEKFEISWTFGKKITPISSEINSVPILKRYWENVANEKNLNQLSNIIKENKIFGSAKLEEFFPEKKNGEIPKISLMLGLQSTLQGEVKKTLYSYVEDVFNVVKLIIEHENSTKNALRAAVAAIMARNMSHQQGSAVIPYVEIGQFIIKQYLMYIQQRMDFIATIATTEFPSWGIPIPFFKELIVDFVSQYGMLNSLCKSEGHNYENIKFKVYINDNKNLLAEKDPNTISQKDVEVFIPGGLSGKHAFYLILENILRNAAKYGEKKNSFDINIKIKKRNDHYEIEIWDNISTISRERKTQRLVENTNIIFCNSLIDSNGNLRNYGWGLAEMRMCAAYLTKGNLKNTAEKITKNECPIKVRERKIGSKNKVMSHVFKLLKPALLEAYLER